MVTCDTKKFSLVSASAFLRKSTSGASKGAQPRSNKVPLQEALSVMSQPLRIGI